MARRKNNKNHSRAVVAGTSSPPPPAPANNPPASSEGSELELLKILNGRLVTETVELRNQMLLLTAELATLKADSAQSSSDDLPHSNSPPAPMEVLDLETSHSSGSASDIGEQAALSIIAGVECDTDLPHPVKAAPPSEQHLCCLDLPSPPCGNDGDPLNNNINKKKEEDILSPVESAPPSEQQLFCFDISSPPCSNGGGEQGFTHNPLNNSNKKKENNNGGGKCGFFSKFKLPVAAFSAVAVAGIILLAIFL